MTLDYRVHRAGKVWLAWLKRPGNPRPLFVEGRTKHEAIAALLTTVGRMAKSAPERLFGRDWTEAANERAAAAEAARRAALPKGEN